jgi:hypothetical protein
MKSASKLINTTLVLVIFLVCGIVAAGQEKVIDKEVLKEAVKEKVKNKSFCGQENWSSDDKVQFRELREMTVAAGGVLDVDAGRNGGISVKGENRSDILVRACVQAWGATEDASRAAVAAVKITTAGGVRADGPDESNYSVSFQILVPRLTDLRLKAHNGGISIGSVDGNLQFETINGGVSLSDVAGEVRGRTTNGGVNVSLTGTAWKGSGLDVQTSNGGVHISMPENYAANVEAGTVNGGFSSDIAALNVEKDDRGRSRNTKVATSLNGGGAPIRLTTTNGGIRISSSTEKY